MARAWVKVWYGAKVGTEVARTWDKVWYGDKV